MGTHERVRNPEGAKKSLERDVEKVVTAMNKKEKDKDVKQRRQTHVRAFGDLNVNAQFQQEVSENEERIQEMIEKEEERELTRITESGQDIQGQSGEHMSNVHHTKPTGKGVNEGQGVGEGEDGETTTTTTEGSSNETGTTKTTTEGDGNETTTETTEGDGSGGGGGEDKEPTESGQETSTSEVNNDAITLDIQAPEINVNVQAPDIKMPEVNIPKVNVPKVSIPTGSMPTIDLSGLKNLAPTIKIIFGWGQILSSFNLTFKIQWPQAFDDLMSAMYMPFNVDVFAAFKDFGCSVPSDYITAFYMHMAMLPMLLTVIFVAWLTAKIYKKLMCCKLCKPHYDDKTLYARVLKLTNLLVFFMYPGMGLRIFRVFAPVCFSPKETKDSDLMNPTYSEIVEECELGQTYMRSDLSINTEDPRYKTMKWFAGICIAVYVIGIPSLYILILYKKRHIIAKDPENGEQIHPDDHQEVMRCQTEFGSMYKDYKRKYYWFELVEMSRKILLVGALVLSGNGGMQIFAGIIICFVYILLASYLEPLTSKTDAVLQYMTSIQLFFTLISGLMLNYRNFEKKDGIGDAMQDKFLEVILMLTTVIVFVVIVAVVASLFTALKSIKKAKDAEKAAKKEEEEKEKEKEEEKEKEKEKELQDNDKVKTATL